MRQYNILIHLVLYRVVAVLRLQGGVGLHDHGVVGVAGQVSRVVFGQRGVFHGQVIHRWERVGVLGPRGDLGVGDVYGPLAEFRRACWISQVYVWDHLILGDGQGVNLLGGADLVESVDIEGQIR